MNSFIKKDLYRYSGAVSLLSFLRLYITKPDFRYLVRLRRYQSSPSFFNRWLLHNSTWQTHIEIGWKCHIEEGLLLIHPSGICINNDCVIGKNCNIYGGATIGTEFRGERAGSPVIGNRVWIGASAAVIGRIHIGDDVLIAPNAFVNFDVPDHSVVIGNPAKIIRKENATEGYIERFV